MDCEWYNSFWTLGGMPANEHEEKTPAYETKMASASDRNEKDLKS